MSIAIPQATRSFPPLLKWAGGKRFLTSRLLGLTPPRFGRYFEPFLGGGALFFALQPDRATLSDTNEDLIGAYSEIRDNPEKVIQTLRRWPNGESEYYRIRASSPQAPHIKAARFLYLTGYSFNGIYRVNKHGQFNVPYGFKSAASWTDARIVAASDALAGKRILSGDFEEITDRARPGDLIYFDPPYTVAHSNNGFVKYNAKIFSWADQLRLAEHAERLRLRGCHVIISNADHCSIRELYPNFVHDEVERFSIMAAASQYRKKITESIFHSGNIDRC